MANLIKLQERGKEKFVSTQEILVSSGLKVTPRVALNKALRVSSFKLGTDYIKEGVDFLVTQKLAFTILNANKVRGHSLDINMTKAEIKEVMKSTDKGGSNRVKSQKIPEKVEAPQEKSYKNDIPTLGASTHVDYACHLSSPMTFGISNHAIERIKERCDLGDYKNEVDFIHNKMCNFGRVAIQEDGNQIWGDGKIFAIINLQTRAVITVLTEGMILQAAQTTDFPILRSQVEDAIDDIKLGETKEYWNKLADCLTQMGEFASSLGTKLNNSVTDEVKVKNGSIDKIASEGTIEYSKRSYAIETLVNDHYEKQRFLDNFKKVN